VSKVCGVEGGGGGANEPVIRVVGALLRKTSIEGGREGGREGEKMSRA
jgi:hypothetical protein